MHENERKTIENKSQLILISKLDKLSINNTKDDLVKSINESICLYYVNLELSAQYSDVNELKKFCEKIQISKNDKLVLSKSTIFKCPIQLDLNMSVINNSDLNGDKLFMHLIILSGVFNGENSADNYSDYFLVNIKNKLIYPNIANWSLKVRIFKYFKNFQEF